MLLLRFMRQIWSNTCQAWPTWWQTFYRGGMSLANLNKFPPFFVMLSDADAPRDLRPGGGPGRGSLVEERRFAEGVLVDAVFVGFAIITVGDSVASSWRSVLR